jgi:hypothetical protein
MNKAIFYSKFKLLAWIILQTEIDDNQYMSILVQFLPNAIIIFFIYFSQILIFYKLFYFNFTFIKQ